MYRLSMLLVALLAVVAFAADLLPVKSINDLPPSGPP